MVKKYNIGVLGCANIAIRSLLPTFGVHSHFNVTAIASRSLDKAQQTAKPYNCNVYGAYEELISDPEIDLIYVPLPTGLHAEWITKALENGKHVMSEKSLGCSLAEVEAMVDLARKKNLLLIENFQFRFHSQHKWVMNKVKEGLIGDIRCFRSSFGFPPFPDSGNIRYNKLLGGGALLDAGAYTLKALQVILPNHNFQLKAASLYSAPDSEVELWGGAYLDSPSGIVAELSFGFDNFYQCNYEIWGSKGKIIATRAFTAPANFQPTVIIEQQGIQDEMTLPADDHFANMLTHIAKNIDNQQFEAEYRQNINQATYIEQTKALAYGK